MGLSRRLADRCCIPAASDIAVSGDRGRQGYTHSQLMISIGEDITENWMRRMMRDIATESATS